MTPKEFLNVLALKRYLKLEEKTNIRSNSGIVDGLQRTIDKTRFYHEQGSTSGHAKARLQ